MRRSTLTIWCLLCISSLLQAQTYNCTDGSSVTIDDITKTQVGDDCAVSVTADVVISTGGIWEWSAPGGNSGTFNVPPFVPIVLNDLPLGPFTVANEDCNDVGGGFLTVSGPSGSGITCEAIPLPVELVGFTAHQYRNGVLLEWSTASELNNQGFDIQQSRDGQQWESIGFEKGRGNSTRMQEYDFLVRSVADGDHYFRLKQMDEDGQYEYSPVVHTIIGRTGGELDVYPNPVRQGQGIAINGSFRELALFDSAGRRVRTISKVLDQEEYLIDLSPGIYFLQGHLEEQMISKKLVVIR